MVCGAESRQPVRGGKQSPAARDRAYTAHFLGVVRVGTPPCPESVPPAMGRLLNIVGDTLRV